MIKLTKTRTLLIVFVIIFGGMTAYEVVKQYLFPNIGLWQSHMATIIFSTAIGLICAYFLFDKFMEIQENQGGSDKALREREERFRKSQKYANIGTWDWNIQTGELLWSDMIAPLFGYDASKVETTYENFLNAIHPDDRQMVTDAVQSCIDDGTKYDIEHRVVWPDGSVHWVREEGDVERLSSGTATRMLGVVIDINERKKSEETLRKLSRAVEQSPSAVFITNTEGIIEYVNPMFTIMMGYEENEVLGETPRILKSSDTPKEVHADIWETIKAGHEWRGELKNKHKNGSYFWAHAIIAPVRNAVGAITHFVAVHEDISERKDADFAIHSALKQADIANRAKTELMANMSHELRTPLNAIIGFSGTIMAEIFGPIGNEKYEEYINDISNSGQHLLELINDILDVSAIEAGKLELHEDQLEIGKLVDDSLRLVKHRADEGGVKLLTTIDPGLPQVYADGRRMKQILLNLLSNAVKFTPAEGTVSLQASLDGNNELIITVADTGIGMDKMELAKAMTQFGQVDRGNVAKHEGTGLGLPLTKGLIELHEGTLDITSEKGVGTTVIARFPKERVVANA